mgnify:CR=1 FL=1
MYRDKKKQKKVIKVRVFEHPIELASKKEKLPVPSQIFEQYKDKKKVKKPIKKRK